MLQLSELKQQLQELKANNPKLRNRDLAAQLNISEAELLTLSLGEGVTRLEGDFKELLNNMHRMGYVMALSRNEHCVHERKGVYENITFYKGPHNMGVAVNPDIDLRFFMNEWHYALAVVMQSRGKELFSFQFFNKKGEAVHKIFSTPKSDLEAYHQLVEEFKATEQSPIVDADRSPYKTAELIADEDVDIAAFQAEWRALQDTHDFFGLLRKHKLQRTQALRLAPENYTQRLDNKAVVRALEHAADQEIPIMCFVHSKGIVQIHTGPVKNLMFYGDWYNVMDPAFNLHLNTKSIKESWIVKKPTADGDVTSLELFDESGELITYFFGKRKPGEPELQSWRDLIERISETSNN